MHTISNENWTQHYPRHINFFVAAMSSPERKCESTRMENKFHYGKGKTINSALFMAGQICSTNGLTRPLQLFHN